MLNFYKHTHTPSLLKENKGCRPLVCFHFPAFVCFFFLFICSERHLSNTMSSKLTHVLALLYFFFSYFCVISLLFFLFSLYFFSNRIASGLFPWFIGIKFEIQIVRRLFDLYSTDLSSKAIKTMFPAILLNFHVP